MAKRSKALELGKKLTPAVWKGSGGAGMDVHGEQDSGNTASIKAIKQSVKKSQKEKKGKIAVVVNNQRFCSARVGE